MLQEDYTVTLDGFQGPLDLLLYLIRQAEVDIQDIPVARITDQYLAFLRQVDDIDIDQAGEFLVMAAALIELKSRTLSPRSAEEGDGDVGEGQIGEATDPRFELVQQLLAYQRFRVAGEELDAGRLEFAQRHAARPAAREEVEEAPDDEEDLELEDAHVLDLSEVYERLISAIDFDKLGDHHVEMDDTPIELYEEDLLDRLHRADLRRLTLQDVFDGHSRVQRIGFFLATLELVRLRRVTVLQPEIISPIELVLNDDPDEALIIESDLIVGHEREAWGKEAGGKEAGAEESRPAPAVSSSPSPPPGEEG